MLPSFISQNQDSHINPYFTLHFLILATRALKMREKIKTDDTLFHMRNFKKSLISRYLFLDMYNTML
jgi:hypothetical protein